MTLGILLLILFAVCLLTGLLLATPWALDAHKRHLHRRFADLLDLMPPL